MNTPIKIEVGDFVLFRNGISKLVESVKYTEEHCIVNGYIYTLDHRYYPDEESISNHDIVCVLKTDGSVIKIPQKIKVKRSGTDKDTAFKKEVLQLVQDKVEELFKEYTKQESINKCSCPMVSTKEILKVLNKVYKIIFDASGDYILAKGTYKLVNGRVIPTNEVAIQDLYKLLSDPETLKLLNYERLPDGKIIDCDGNIIT